MLILVFGIPEVYDAYYGLAKRSSRQRPATRPATQAAMTRPRPPELCPTRFAVSVLVSFTAVRRHPTVRQLHHPSQVMTHLIAAGRPGEDLESALGATLTSSNLASSAIALTGQNVEGPHRETDGALRRMRSRSFGSPGRLLSHCSSVRHRGVGPAPTGARRALPAATARTQQVRDAPRGSPGLGHLTVVNEAVSQQVTREQRLALHKVVQSRQR